MNFGEGGYCPHDEVQIANASANPPSLLKNSFLLLLLLVGFCVFLLYTNREEKMLVCSRFSEGEGVFFINPPEVCINSKKDPGL